MKSAKLESRGRRVLPSLVVGTFAIAYILIGYLSLDAASRRVPILTGMVTLLLLGLDTAKRLRQRDAASAPLSANDGIMARAAVSVGREITAILLLAAAVGGIYLIGFAAAIPLYLIASIAFLGGQSFRTAIIISLPASILIYSSFELILSYRLFQGVLFS